MKDGGVIVSGNSCTGSGSSPVVVVAAGEEVAVEVAAEGAAEGAVGEAVAVEAIMRGMTRVPSGRRSLIPQEPTIHDPGLDNS